MISETTELDFPDMRAAEGESTAATCLLAVCEYFHISAEGGGAFERLLDNPEPSLADIEAAAKDLGFETSTGIGLPAIADIGDNQWVVAFGFFPDGFIVLDPVEGHRFIEGEFPEEYVVCDIPDAEREEDVVALPPDVYEELAAYYASTWNQLHGFGERVEDDELQTASEELEAGNWYVHLEPDGTWHVLPAGDVHAPLLATKGLIPAIVKSSERAPKGGITLKSKTGELRFYRGGQWIPASEIDKLSPQQKQKLEDAKKATKETRASRGDVDEAKLRERLGKHGRDLTFEERKQAERQFRALYGHHKELTLHRLEELADQQERLLERMQKNPTRAVLGPILANLAKMHAMIDMAKGQGVTGKLDRDQYPAPSSSAAIEEPVSGTGSKPPEHEVTHYEPTGPSPGIEPPEPVSHHASQFVKAVAEGVPETVPGKGRTKRDRAKARAINFLRDWMANASDADIRTAAKVLNVSTEGQDMFYVRQGVQRAFVLQQEHIIPDTASQRAAARRQAEHARTLLNADEREVGREAEQRRPVA